MSAIAYNKMVQSLPAWYTPGPHLEALLTAWGTVIDEVAQDYLAIPGIMNLLNGTGPWLDWGAGLFGVTRFPNEPDQSLFLRLIQQLQPRLTAANIISYMQPFAIAPVIVNDNSGGRSVGRVWTHYNRGVVATDLTFTRSSVAYSPINGVEVAANVPTYGVGIFGNNTGIALWQGTTNLFSTGISDSTTTTGWTALGGATVALSTTTVWQGTDSVEVSSAAGGGVSTSQAIASGSQAWYTFSSVMSAPAGAAVTLTLIDATNSVTLGTASYTLSSTWTQVGVTGETAANTASLTCEVLIDNTTSTIYLGAQQLEEAKLATPWQAADNATRAAPTLTIPAADFPTERGTLEAIILPGWTGMLTTVENGTFAEGASFCILNSGGSNNLVSAFDIAYDNTTGTYVSDLTTSITGGTTCTAVFTQAELSPGGLLGITWDLGSLGVYWNGQLVASATGTVNPSVGTAAYLGMYVNGTDTFDGVLGPVRILEQARFANEMMNDYTWFSEAEDVYTGITAWENLWEPNGNTWGVWGLANSLGGLQGSNLHGAAWYGRVRLIQAGQTTQSNPFTIGLSAIEYKESLLGSSSTTALLLQDLMQVFNSVRPAGPKIALELV